MRLKPFLIGTGLALVGIVGIVAVAISRFDPTDYVPLATAKVKEFTGRELSIDGKIGLVLSLVPTVSIENVRFGNAAWGRRPDMVTAKRVEVQIALLSLLGGKVDVRGLTLIEPDVLLETDANGKGNWIFDRSDAEPTESDGSSQRVDLRRAHIENGVLTYRSGNDKQGTKLDGVRLDMKTAAQRHEIDLDARLNAEPIQLRATVDRDAAATKVDATTKSRGMTFTLTGVLGDGSARGPTATSKFEVEVHDWNAVSKLAGVDPIQLPGLKATGNMKRAGADWLIEGIKAHLGKSDFAGTVRIGKGAPGSTLDIKFESNLVDLPELQSSRKKAPAKDGRVFSSEPFPIDALKALRGRMDVRVGRLVMKDGKSVDGVELQATAQSGRIHAEPVRFKIEGRELRVRANFDASSGKTLAADIGIDGTGISLGALSALLNLSGTPEGSPTDLSIRFAGRGQSMRTLMADANADVRIVVGPGRLRNRGIDWSADVTELLNALNPARASEPYTELKCAVVRLPIRQGIARIDNSIAAETSKVNMIAAGVIDLRDETLDLGFRPKAATGLGIGLGGLASLGRLRGSLAAPKVELDMGGTAKAAAQLGLAAATGGLSLLAGGLLSPSVPERPCQVALAGSAHAPESQGKQRTSIVDDVMGGIKRLFESHPVIR